MFDFIRKPTIWKAWDEGLETSIGKTTHSFGLKSIQDLAVYGELKEETGKAIAEIGAGYSRVLLALAKANRCVAVEKFEGKGGGPKTKKADAGVEHVSAYLGVNDPLLPTAAFDVVFSISVVEHVQTSELAAFHADQLRILKPGGVFMHAIDMYLQDTPEAQYVRRFEAYRAWVALTRGVEPVGPVYWGTCRFTNDMATNPDNTLYRWGKSAPNLINLRQQAQSVSLLLAGRKLNGSG